MSLLEQSKDFFIEYDSKKLKDIFEFLSENTTLTNYEFLYKYRMKTNKYTKG